MNYPKCMYRMITYNIIEGVKILVSKCTNKELLRSINCENPVRIENIMVCFDCGFRPEDK